MERGHSSTTQQMTRKRKRGHGWGSVGRKRQSSRQPVLKEVKVRFVCPAIQEEKRFKVRSTYEYSPGLRSVLHYPQQGVEPHHEPYTCKPRKVRVRSTYEYEHSSGLQTTLHYPQEIVLKHFVIMEQPPQDTNDIPGIEYTAKVPFMCWTRTVYCKKNIN